MAATKYAATKHCGGCDQTKPRDAKHFHHNKRSGDGLQGWCRPCMNRYRSPNWPVIELAPDVPIVAEVPVTPADDKRYQAVYDRSLRIVNTYRDTWPAIEEITQPWGCGEPA